MRNLVLAALIALASSSPASAQQTTENRATVYAFFATWCVPCRIEIPHLERLHRTYKDQGLRIVLVSEDAPSTAQSVPSFLARFDVTAEWMVDSESELLSRYNSSGGVPYTVLLDASGNTVWAHAGYEPGDELALESQIETLLTGEAPRTNEPTDLRVSASSQSLGIWRKSRFQLDDRRKRAVAQRLEVGARLGLLTASMRLDGDLIEEAGETDRNVRVERAYLGYQGPRLELGLGDDYVQFGHGLSLSLRKIDALGLDTTLRGAHTQASLGGVTTKVLAGITNRQNLDSIDLQGTEDESDRILGVETAVSLGERSAISPYVLAAEAKGAASDGSDVRWVVGGTSTQLAFDSLVLAAEAAAGTRKGFSASETRETIWAAYASGQWNRSDISVLVDGKAYRDWAIGRTRNERPILYHEAPTLERDDQEVPANDNAMGARGRVEWRIPTTTATVFANLLAYQFSQDGTSAVDGDLALHGYVGGELRIGDATSLGLQTGYRDENKSDGSDKLSLYHVDVDLATALTSKLSATFKWNHREETKVVFNELTFRRGLVVGGLAWSGLVAASILYGYSTEQATTPTHYPAAELLFHLPKGGSLRLFAGRLVGGRICVSGSCRDVPPFEGVRLDLIVKL